MPRFFFDVSYGDQHIVDALGIDLDTLDDVPREGFAILRDIVYDKMPEGHHTLIVEGRNLNGRKVYRGVMTLDGRRFFK